MKKEKKVWVITLLSLWWLPPNKTIAQQDSVRQLHEVVITATRSEQPVMEIPRSVTVIHRRELENAAYNSVGELLANHPGIFIVGTNQVPGTNQSLFLRGANSNQAVVLIDGMRITDPSSPGSSIDLSELSLAGVERIEVIRGAHSTLFGGSAIGGAINIITKKKSEPGLHGMINAQAATFGKRSLSTTTQGALQYAFRNGVYLNGSISHTDVQGLNATVDTVSNDAFKTSDQDDFNKTDAFVKAGWLHGKWDTWLSFRKTDQYAEIDDGAYNDDDNAYVSFDRRHLSWNARYQADEKISVGVLGSWSDSRRRNENDSSVADRAGNYDRTFFDSYYSGELLTNELVVQYKGKPVEVIVGVGQFREDMRFHTYYFSNSFGFPYESSTNYDSLDPGASTAYAFAQLVMEQGNFGLTGGARFSNHSRFGGNRTFEVSPYYRIKDLLLFTSVSTGFNAPSLYQLFDPSHGFGAYTTRGNPTLKAEKSFSVEAGVKKEFSDGSYFTLSAFRSLTRDAIEYVYLWNRDVAIASLGYEDYFGDTYINVARQVINGIEGAGQINLGNFYLRANLTLLKGRIAFSPDDIDTKHTGSHHVQPYNYGAFVNTEVETSRLIRKPAVTGFAEAGYKVSKGLVTTVTLRHAGSRFDVAYDPAMGPFGALGRTNVKTYDLIDIGATWQITPSWMVNVRIENAFDTDYREIEGFQTRGRSCYLKAQYRF